jgi:YegS/Rv2252/BmrU family lipid kinase
MTMTPIVIMNPQSANGSTRKRLEACTGALRQAVGDFDVKVTSGPGDATRLTQEALNSGHEWIIAAGGDGTIHEVVNGFFREDGTPIGTPTLSLFPSGTGGDYRKTWGLDSDPKSAIQRLAVATPQPADAGRITWTTPQGNQASRYFANIASVGLGARVSDQANKQSKVLGGKVSFYIASLRAMISWKNLALSMRVDDGPLRSLEGTIVAMCIGQFFGGGMQFGPNADPSDGLFDVVTLEGAGRLELVRMTSIYKGQHLDHPKVSVTRGRVVELQLEAPADSALEADGEVFGSLPARFEILPQAFRIKV